MTLKPVDLHIAGLGRHTLPPGADDPSPLPPSLQNPLHTFPRNIPVHMGKLLTCWQQVVEIEFGKSDTTDTTDF